MITPLVILVRPQMGENIGASARAMLNFGLTGLRLVEPRDGWPNAKAGAMAAGASQVIDGARVFGSVEEAVSDCAYVLATTARQRGVFVPVHEPEDAAGRLVAHAQDGLRTAVLFGGEKSGLSTDDLAFADAILTVPVNPQFSSLNLAQAVLLVAYEWSRAAGSGERFESPYDQTPAGRESTEGMITHLFNALEATGYFYPEAKRPTLERNLRTMLTHAKLTEAETRLFRGVVRQLARRQDEGT
ncbi:RNA methyltransferase [Parvularcula dongshanensis]|uniref:tRNA/rRNA methyltransferase n=1 Tax=Parvularcula dongshanensis TaxID=1173995 RepID=A0A840I5P9_9PROT|nr:RNA methyltransferase [Parvularcula dongshanensis]MBB4659601.1 tRNA/rRNA methyltransferase [Parvularcula dongshanensis]